MHAQSTNLPDEKGCNVRFSVFFGNRMFDSFYCWTCLVKQQFCGRAISCVFKVEMMLKAGLLILKYYWLL